MGGRGFSFHEHHQLEFNTKVINNADDTQDVTIRIELTIGDPSNNYAGAAMKVRISSTLDMDSVDNHVTSGDMLPGCACGPRHVPRRDRRRAFELRRSSQGPPGVQRPLASGRRSTASAACSCCIAYEIRPTMTRTRGRPAPATITAADSTMGARRAPDSGNRARCTPRRPALASPPTKTTLFGVLCGRVAGGATVAAAASPPWTWDDHYGQGWVSTRSTARPGVRRCRVYAQRRMGRNAWQRHGEHAARVRPVVGHQGDPHLGWLRLCEK